MQRLLGKYVKEQTIVLTKNYMHFIKKYIHGFHENKLAEKLPNNP